jgi:hypothetical protein
MEMALSSQSLGDDLGKIGGESMILDGLTIF